MRRAWITGAGGLIGSHVAARTPADWLALPLRREQFDLADFSAVRAAFQRDRPDLVIHCAALSKSPVCEANPELARKINVDATRCLAELAANIPLVFLSTDLVFDGRAGNYIETDEPNPLTVYGRTKVAAEQIVLANPRHIIVRSSLNGGVSPTGDRGFSDELINAWRGGRIPKLFTDEFRSPLLAETTARAVWELAQSGVSGIHHIAGSERLSRYRIGELLAAHCPELHPRIQAASIAEYSGPWRSPDTSLNCAKVEALLSFPLPRFSEQVRAGTWRPVTPRSEPPA